MSLRGWSANLPSSLSPPWNRNPPGLMGPVVGMSPDKKAGSPGSQGGACGAGTLPEAESASSPLATSLDRLGRAGTGGAGTEGETTEDEELTNLNWLHENLLQNFSLGGPEDIEGSPDEHPLSSSSSSSISSSLSGGQAAERDPLKSKPPFSFSLLIFMAIEQSPSKSLPVKDIYSWILQHFPYFSSAPTGWKNSVRHNLSLNKCFRKVERSLGKTNGKGSLWCVDPEFRPTLAQALRKQHFPNTHAFYTPPASPPSASSPPHHLLLMEQGSALRESDFDAATAMMLLKSASEQHSDPYDQEGPIDLSRRGEVVLVSRDPQQDHNYSSSPPPPLSRDVPSARRAQAPGPVGGKRVRLRHADLDEELKEAAGSLLHLAGVRPSLQVPKQRGRKSRKISRK
ncbi:forkhead box protein N2b isoform X2 [Clupea harengus]|uniref:Forkhead box protein N2b isoform X2 n=1 Tax=Clupea harengus TaxID=7950 RepID=A0A6P8GHG9_CLUHA|nr:forkhead box protein N2b isoform X2 [Clupea harengus]